MVWSPKLDFPNFRNWMVSSGNWHRRIHDFTSGRRGRAGQGLPHGGACRAGLSNDPAGLMALIDAERREYLDVQVTLEPQGTYHFLRWKAGWLAFSASQVYTQTSWLVLCEKPMATSLFESRFSNQNLTILFFFDEDFLLRKGPCWGGKHHSFLVLWGLVSPCPQGSMKGTHCPNGFWDGQ